mmetsp:Transcript_1289/g.3005  ORF Transcript_1289/g.3005 Transcript_1289/m.3005 type:complete len:199 (+) Transcript_1289:110-706(+)
MGKAKYGNWQEQEANGEEKTAKTRITYAKKQHFKKCREVGHAIKGMSLLKATWLLEQVLVKKRGIPMKRFTGGCGRHAVGKQDSAPGNCVAFPQKATKLFLDLLTNVKANAEEPSKGLDPTRLVIKRVQVNRAPNTRRRTYRAHGRIGKYEGHPAHIEIEVEEQAVAVQATADKPVVRLTSKRAAQLRVKVGGGAASA